MVVALSADFDKAVEIADIFPEESTKLLQQVISNDGDDEETSKLKEQAIYKLADLYTKQGKVAELGTLLKSIRPFFSTIPKAKTAKIVRTIIDSVSKIPNSVRLQIELCLESIEWTRSEKRTFLRQRIEARLAALYLQTKDYSQALSILTNLIREVKRLDDKLLLVEIQLLESQVHHALRNLPKARASLTSARTTANSIYCPPTLQAEIDMQAGTLHAEEKDYKTGYSYFYEAFEGFSSLEDERAVLALKYMLLCKIMTNNSEDVHQLINGKAAIRYAGPDIDAMRAVAKAHTDRSVHAFEAALKSYHKELADDSIIHAHLSALYNTLLEQNLCRLIEPFSRVEIAHVSKLINLPLPQVEAKLSQMILDKKFLGILDQGAGCLVVFDEPPQQKTYPAALETIENLSKVVDSLYEKAQQAFVTELQLRPLSSQAADRQDPAGHMICCVLARSSTRQLHTTISSCSSQHPQAVAALFAFAPQQHVGPSHTVYLARP
eukprot:CAMPEP_0196657758 /NCGR_PEP_ID=MMETSP1086-20130531/25343_1 /TAXON_ID=77921 /ORGANISM="Cyanoptyche  gloeocystis , Strain SAG4.97" /LENGTH=493 /DNA_ID=CAMNT_0041991017 /DNA_START=42 /DNA_END=1523 /DNA_ORIENTATION=+